jgi:hypothetical protein
VRESSKPGELGPEGGGDIADDDRETGLDHVVISLGERGVDVVAPLVHIDSAVGEELESEEGQLVKGVWQGVIIGHWTIGVVGVGSPRVECFTPSNAN